MNSPQEQLLYAPICKVDTERREVYGYATTPSVDHQGEVITLEAVQEALPNYLRYPTVREMHQPSAVGKGIEATLNEKGLWFGAKIVDDRAWKKVVEGVYSGFSIGGRILKRDKDDPKIVKAIDLVEISLVDRPCNPDARFELIKRSPTGLKVEPGCIWISGVPSDEGLMKGNRRLTGQFASRDQLHQEALELQRKHEELAGEAERKGQIYQRRASAAQKEANAQDLLIHSSLAQAASAVAEHHRNIARQYRNIAEALANDSEVAMSDVAKVIVEAGEALRKLESAIKAEPDPNASGSGKNPPTPPKTPESAHETMVTGQNEDARAIAEIAAAVQLRAEAEHSKVSDPEKSKQLSAEAAAHEISAMGALDLANEYHSLVLDYLRKPAGSSGSQHDSKEDQKQGTLTVEGMPESTAMVKAAADSHCRLAKEFREGLEECAKTLKGHLKKLRKGTDGDYDDDDDDDGDEPEEEEDDVKKFRLALKKASKSRKVLAKEAGIIETRLRDLARIGGGEEKDKDDVLKVKKSSKLVEFPGIGFLDKKGQFFGKRKFSDEKRQELADKGHALPDGSFPIENETDLENAIQAYGRAKDKEKAKKHIIRRAKELGATDKLPEDWPGSTKGKEKAQKSDSGEPIRKDYDVPDYYRIMRLAELLSSLSAFCDEYGISTFITGEDPKHVESLKQWLDEGNRILEELVAEEIEKSSALEKSEFRRALVKSGKTKWLKTLAKIFSDKNRKALAKGLRKLRKKVKGEIKQAEKERIDKKVEKKLAKLAKRFPQNQSEELAKARRSSMDAELALRNFTAQLIPLARSAQEHRERLAKMQQENEELRKRLEALEKQPVPSGTKIDPSKLTHLRAVGKDEDGKGTSGSGGNSSLFSKIMEIEDPKQRAKAILEAGLRLAK